MSFDLCDRKNDILVDLAMHAEFSRLSEGAATSLMGTDKRLLTCVDVHMLLQVLRQRERFLAEMTDVALTLMRGKMSTQGKARCVLLVATSVSAAVGLLGHSNFNSGDTSTFEN